MRMPSRRLLLSALAPLSGLALLARNQDARAQQIDAAKGELQNRSSVGAVWTVRELRLYLGAAPVVICSGYHEPGDGGGGSFFWAPNDAAPEDGGTVFASEGRDGRWRRITTEGTLNVRWFGARGTGKADDFRAFAAAQAVAVQRGLPVHVPPGNYALLSGGLEQNGGFVRWTATPHTATIGLRDDAYFMTLSGRISRTWVSGLRFNGGLGGFRYMGTSDNVTGHHVFVDCEFSQYRECAISNNSIDHPYLKVSRCWFRGNGDFDSTGIAWGGYIDNSSIENCSFLINRYHVKLGPRLSGNVSLTDNDFISFVHDHRDADIWIVPNTDEWRNVNGGLAINISRNKFGNEHTRPQDSRILIAREDTSDPGTARGVRRPDLAPSEGAAHVLGLIVKENRFSGVNGSTAPLIKSYIDDVTRVIFKDNQIDGGPYTYLVEFKNEQQVPLPYYALDWVIDLRPRPLGTRTFSRGISNRPVGILEDGAAVGSGGAYSKVSGTTPDASFQLVASTALGTLRFRDKAAPRADDNAIRIAYEKTSDVAILETKELPSNEMLWLDFTARTLDRPDPAAFEVRLVDSITRRIAWRQVFTLGPSWTTTRVPLIAPEIPAASWRWEILPADPAKSGVTLAVRHLHVYRGAVPVGDGSLITLGTGGWNDGHIMLGTNHLWVDQQGVLRIKNSAPTRDDDGRTVG